MTMNADKISFSLLLLLQTPANKAIKECHNRERKGKMCFYFEFFGDINFCTPFMGLSNTSNPHTSFVLRSVVDHTRNGASLELRIQNG